MKWEDILDVTKKSIAMTMGTEYMTEKGLLETLDTSKLVDIGKDVENAGSLDGFAKAMLSLIGKMQIESREYSAETLGIMVSNFEWGGFIERIKVLPYDILKDEMYELVDNKDYSALEHTFFAPDVIVKIYEEAKEIMTARSYSDNAIKEAFRGPGELGSFISAMETAVRNTIQCGLEAYAHMLVTTGIAVSDAVTGKSVHLLTDYEKVSGVELTAEKSLLNSEFLSYACETISAYRDRLRRFTAMYNNGSIPMPSKMSDQNLVLHSDFARSVKFHLRANTYNDELIGVGKYRTTPSWQAWKKAGETEGTTTDGFAVTSAISIKASAKLGLTADYNKQYAIGILFDRMAMGVCPFREKTTSSYTASADFHNFFHHLMVNYILDTDYPIVSFFLD